VRLMTMNEASFWPRFILAVLATWRVTHLLASEDGPGDLIVRFRALVGQSLAGRLMDCFNCLSLWIAAPAALFVARQLLDWVLVWLAVSAGACLLDRLGRQTVVLEPVPQSSEGDPHHVLWSETSGVAEQFDSSHGADRAASKTWPSGNSGCPNSGSGTTFDGPERDCCREPAHPPAGANHSSPITDRDTIFPG
jgi:hypothetical protein